MTLLVHQNTGKENRYGKIFALRTVYWGDLIEQIKKNCHIHLKKNIKKGVRILEFITFEQNALHLTRVHYLTNNTNMSHRRADVLFCVDAGEKS